MSSAHSVPSNRPMASRASIAGWCTHPGHIGEPARGPGRSWASACGLLGVCGLLGPRPPAPPRPQRPQTTTGHKPQPPDHNATLTSADGPGSGLRLDVASWPIAYIENNGYSLVAAFASRGSGSPNESVLRGTDGTSTMEADTVVLMITIVGSVLGSTLTTIGMLLMERDTRAQGQVSTSWAAIPRTRGSGLPASRAI